jgi:nucleoside-diphosphate-sugar epimerase
MKARELCRIPQLARGELPVVVDHVLNVIDVRDVASSIVRVAQRALFGQTIPLVGHQLTMMQEARAIASFTGASPPTLSIPASVGVASLAALETALRWAGLAPQTPTLAWMLIGAIPPGLVMSPVQAALGVSLRPLGVSIVDALRWYRALGYW